MPEERLQKILARAGYGSRRSAEEFIARGRVTVDGLRAEIGSRADPGRQRIEVDGHPIRLETRETRAAQHQLDQVIRTGGTTQHLCVVLPGPGAHTRTL